MTTSTLETPQALADEQSDLQQEHAFLERARSIAKDRWTPYAGSVTPTEAWQLACEGNAVIVDVRSQEEYKFVGHPPKTVNVPWQIGTNLLKNPRFLKDLENLTGSKNQVALLLCRSGKRSAAAAEAASRAGFTSVFNILEGFEGDITPDGQRGATNGWRSKGLPWIQD